jgi:hypothetical protein
MITEEFNQNAVDQIKAIMSEHFSNYAFVVLEDDGTLFYDYNNHIIGEALFAKSLQDMLQDSLCEAMNWDEEDEEYD